MDLNKALVIGRLTRDPEMRSTPSGTNVCSFSIASNYVYTNAGGQKIEQVEYHNVVAWRKLGEIAAQYLKKGSRVYIEGRIQTRSWEDKEGAKKNRTEIVLDNMIMLDSKGASGGSGAGGSSGASFSAAMKPSGGAAANANKGESAENSASSGEDFISAADLPTINQEQPSDSEEITVEDIPF